MNEPPIALFTGYVDPGAADNPFFAVDPRVRSLNRVRFATQPELPLDEDVSGHSAYDLLSAAAVESLVRARLPEVTPESGQAELLQAFDAFFNTPRVASAAREIARTIGRRLGALLLVLVRGNVSDRLARPEWNDDHWAYWQKVRRVIIGGGLWAGNLGAEASQETQRFLMAAGCDLLVERSPFGEAVVLAGLARYAPLETERMLLFDFGQTNVKRGLAIFRDGLLAAIERHPSVPAPCSGGQDGAARNARPPWTAMRKIILDDWRRYDPPDETGGTAIGLALATHLNDGHPFPDDRSRYGRLQSLAPHLGEFMRDDLAARLGRYRSLSLLHDGLAAAATHAGEIGTVLLTFGTAIGAGYPPPLGNLRIVAGDLVLVPASADS